MALVRQDLLGTGMVENLALSNYNTLYGGNNSGGLTWEGKTSANQVLVSMRYVSPGFMSTFPA